MTERAASARRFLSVRAEFSGDAFDRARYPAIYHGNLVCFAKLRSAEKHGLHHADNRIDISTRAQGMGSMTASIPVRLAISLITSISPPVTYRFHHRNRASDW